MSHLSAISRVPVRKAQLEQVLLTVQVADRLIALAGNVFDFKEEYEDSIEELTGKNNDAAE